MNKFSVKTKIIALTLSFIMLLSATVCYELTAFATNEDKVNEYKDKISEYEEKIDAAQEKIDALKGDINSVKEYIQELDKQVALYQEQIDVFQEEIDAYQGQIDEYEAQNDELQNQIEDLNDQIEEYNNQIDEMNELIDEKYDELKNLIRTNFINGESSAIEVLLMSDDFSEYLTKVQFLSSLADYEQGLIDNINGDIAEINKTVEKIDEEKTNIAKIQDEINKKIAEIDKLQSAVEENQAKVQVNQDAIQAKVNQNSNYLASLNNESSEYKQMIAKYEAEIARFDKEIESLLQSNGSSGDGMLENSSGLICPIQYSGRYISSGYYRNSDGSYHGALDICVYGGTYGLKISAAEGGKVITAAYHWSYGNYIVIDHGNGLSTLYAHCSSLAVGAGQNVSKGQTIGYVGSTGNSTGPHLHFEVRINGSRTNPLNYISV